MKTAKETSEIYERIRDLCAKNKTSILKLYREIYGKEKSEGNLTTWKKGNFAPKDLINISKKFGLSTDFLIKGEILEKDEKILNDLQIAVGENIKQMQKMELENSTQTIKEDTSIDKKETDSFYDNDKYSNEIYSRIELMCRFSGKSIENIIENTSIVEKDFENLKNGKAPSFLMLKALSDFFNCSINYLIFGELNHNSEYSNKINTIIKKYKISHEQLTSYSGVPYNILDLFGKGILPIGLLHWRVQNSIENLSGRQESFNFEVDYSKCNYFVCETCEAKNYIEMLKLSQEKQEKVWEFINGLENN